MDIELIKGLAVLFLLGFVFAKAWIARLEWREYRKEMSRRGKKGAEARWGKKDDTVYSTNVENAPKPDQEGVDWVVGPDRRQT